jgi:hypothetical protein
MRRTQSLSDLPTYYLKSILIVIRKQGHRSAVGFMEHGRVDQ